MTAETKKREEGAGFFATEEPAMIFGARLAPRQRFLLDLAAKARGTTRTEYLEWALEESFKNQTLRKPAEPEPTYGHGGEVTVPEMNADSERAANAAMSVANLADKLWSEIPFLRLQAASILCPHLLSNEDNALWNYIHGRSDLKIAGKQGGYKLDREKIIAQWGSILRTFEKQHS